MANPKIVGWQRRRQNLFLRDRHLRVPRAMQWLAYERIPDAREYRVFEAPQQRNLRELLRTVRKQQCGKSRRTLALSKLLCRGRFLLFRVWRGRSLGFQRDETRIAASAALLLALDLDSRPCPRATAKTVSF